MSEFGPFRLSKIGDEQRLLFHDGHMVVHMDLFEELGRLGNGYDWTDRAA